MRERIVADVVQQCGHPDGEAVLLRRGRYLPQLLERGQRPPGQVIGAKRVLETGVSGSWVDQESVTNLSDVAEALDGGSIEG
jgi:hypothetical protein